MEGDPVRMREVPKDKRGQVMGIRAALAHGEYPEQEKMEKQDIPPRMLGDLGIGKE